jgi:ketosteroid isomerase-like protein
MMPAKANREQKLALLDALADCTARGDLAGMAQYLSPELVVYEDAGMPYGGVYHGVAGFLDMLGKITRSYSGMEITRLRAFDGDNDDIAVQIRVRARSALTGAAVEAMTSEIYTIVDGRLTELWVWYWNTPAIGRTLAGVAAARPDEQRNPA